MLSTLLNLSLPQFARQWNGASYTTYLTEWLLRPKRIHLWQVLRTGPGPWKAFYVSSYYHIMPCIPLIIFYLLIYIFFLFLFPYYKFWASQALPFPPGTALWNLSAHPWKTQAVQTASERNLSQREKRSSSPWSAEEQKPHCGVKPSFCYLPQRRCIRHQTAKTAARYPSASKKSVIRTGCVT